MMSFPPALSPAEAKLVAAEKYAMTCGHSDQIFHERQGPEDTRFSDVIWVICRDDEFHYHVVYGWGGSSELLEREAALRLLESWEAQNVQG